MNTQSMTLPTAPRPRGTHRLGNYAKTAILLAGLTALFLAVGQRLGGPRGMFFAGIFVVVMNFVSYWFSDRIALAMHGARALGSTDLPWLHELVGTLTRKAGMPMPRLYVIPSPSPNAFATGRSPQHAAVAVTEGILHLLDRRELAGVLAHELAHVRNRDTLISTVAATLAGIITHLAHMAAWFGGAFFRSSDDDERGGGALETLAMLIVAPLAAMLLQLAVSRSREYGADASGAAMLGDPDALADALQKLDAGVQYIPDNRSPATAHLFIVNPLSGGGMRGLFSTHPSTAERVARLRAMGRGRSLVR